MKKIKKLITMVIAMALVISGLIISDVTTAQAAVKLNKKSASIYAGETVQLKLRGAKSVSWSSSNKKVATVTSKGLVKGVKKGTANIKAKDKKTKKTYTCKVTVKVLKSLGITADDIWAFSGGTVIAYHGAEIKDAIYLLDGKELTPGEYIAWNEQSDTGVYTGIQLSEKLSEGEHTFTIQKNGYQSVTATFTFEKLKMDGMFGHDPWVENGILYIICNPQLEGKNFKVTLDGKEVTPKEQFLNGDGVYVLWIDASGLSAGEHTVTVTAEGLPDGSAKVTI